MSLLSNGHERVAVMLLILAAFVWSLIGARDPRMWFFESLVIVPIWMLLLVTPGWIPLSRIFYRLFGFVALLHLVGAHYMYIDVPLGTWVQEVFELGRNPFDRLVHLSFGLVGVIVARELMLRTSPLQRGKWLACLSFSCVMCASAAYEILEWLAWIPAAREQPGADILGAQGDIWDSQWDMAMAGFGAFLGLLFLRRPHDASIDEIMRPGSRKFASVEVYQEPEVEP